MKTSIGLLVVMVAPIAFSLLKNKLASKNSSTIKTARSFLGSFTEEFELDLKNKKWQHDLSSKIGEKNLNKIKSAIAQSETCMHISGARPSAKIKFSFHNKKYLAIVRSVNTYSATLILKLVCNKKLQQQSLQQKINLQISKKSLMPLATIDWRNSTIVFNELAAKKLEVHDLQWTSMDKIFAANEISKIAAVSAKLFEGRICKIKTTLISGKIIILRPIFKNKCKETITWCVFDAEKDMQRRNRFETSQKLQALGQFVGGIAHDFNNILTAIIGYCDLFLMTKQSPNEENEVMQIKQNSMRAATLINSLLLYSKGQEQASPLVDVAEVIDGIAPLLQRCIGANISLKISATKRNFLISISKNALEQVIMNLVLNARDAMHSGVGEIKISIKRVCSIEKIIIPCREEESFFSSSGQTSSGPYIVIAVEDTGYGIDPKVMSKIFDPFFSTKPPGSGTGIGLSTSLDAINRYGGHIYVSSKVGCGSKFFVSLPEQRLQKEYGTELQKEYNATETLPSANDTKQTESPMLIAKDSKLLIVEDNEHVLAFMAKVLKNQGYTVVSARCGTNGLRKISKEINLLITDALMPNLGGIELAHKARQLFPGLPVILISGYSKDSMESEQLSESGNTLFLQKPFSITQLVSAVKTAMNVKEHCDTN